MQELYGRLPNQEMVLEADAAELGHVLLGIFQHRTGSGTINLHNELCWIDDPGSHQGYPNRSAVKLAIAEAFNWLLTHGLIVEVGGTSGGSHFRVSRAGETIKTEASFADFRVSSQLPEMLIHQSIRTEVRHAFLRGSYDNAVLQSFKAVEVAVREAAQLPAKLLGVALMRDAFHPDRGALRDPEAEAGERHARSELFSGAMGSYKNPQSHRHVALEDPREAVEQIILASHLLHIVDDCRLRLLL